MTTTTTGAGLGALIRRRADTARHQADTDAAFFAELDAWEAEQRAQEAHAALRRIARTHLAHLLRIGPDRLGGAEVTDWREHGGYSGDRAVAGRVTFDLSDADGDTLRFEVAWTGTVTIWLLVGCARTLGDAAHVPDGCQRHVRGVPVATLTELAAALTDPPTGLLCQPCADADPPF